MFKTLINLFIFYSDILTTSWNIDLNWDSTYVGKSLQLIRHRRHRFHSSIAHQPKHWYSCSSLRSFISRPRMALCAFLLAPLSIQRSIKICLTLWIFVLSLITRVSFHCKRVASCTQLCQNCQHLQLLSRLPCKKRRLPMSHQRFLNFFHISL